MGAASLSARLRGPAFAQARRAGRYVAENHVERPIARVVRTRALLDGKAPTLVHVGDSSLLHISPADTDLRRLGEMMSEEVAVRSAQYYGPAYSSALFAEMIRLVSDRARPQCVVVSLGLRTSTHLHQNRHPVFGYQRSIAALQRARRVDAALLARTPRRRPTEADYARFEAISRESRWGLAQTVGEYRARLRRYTPGQEPVERQALLFDYFHGEFSDDSPGLAHWRTFGERLRALDVPVVAYRCWMPVGKGVALHGESFREHVEHNFGLIERSFADGLGRSALVPLDPLPDDCFIDATDGTEHLNERGRRVVVDAVAPEVRAALA